MTTRIMIAEDNTSIISCYHDLLSKDETIEIVGYAKDGKTTIEMYKEKNPDLLLLDLQLPTKNGLQILEELALYESENVKCNVIVVSGKLDLIHQFLNTRKVRIIIKKPFEDTEIINSIKDFQNEQIEDNFLESKCQDLLLKLGLNPISKNGRLLTKAIELCYWDYNLLDNMSLLYTTLAHMKSCSPQRIKSSLRTIINSANRFSNEKTLYSIFFVEVEDIRKGVSPKHFINGLILSLKR